MVFFATCNSVDYFSVLLGKYFENKGIAINFFKLHSKTKQKLRKKQYQKFLNSESGVLLTTDLSSRGIDIPNVKIIVQFDPPKNEEVFIHRVGRTARVGLIGQSILLLTKEEENFISYLEKKNIVINKYEYGLESLDMDIMNSICEINLSDAWIYHKAKQSFVSFIRFYCEHDLKYIFDINKLDIASLANLFSLLKIPRVKEILGKKIDFTPISNKDPNAIEYLNKNTEKQMEEKKIKAQEKLNQILLNKKKLRQKDSEGKKKNRTKKQKKNPQK